MTKQYRKTALITAEQFLPNEGKIPQGVYSSGHGDPRKNPLFDWMLNTLEGPHTLRNGDYICTGQNGEQWNVERSIFEATYEEVAETQLPVDLVEEALTVAAFELRSSAPFMDGSAAKDLTAAAKRCDDALAAMQSYMASDGVTQMDRDAALVLAKQVSSGQVDRIPDYDPFVQAFAAHRRAAAITPQPDPRDAEIERLREALEGMVNEYVAIAESGDAGFWDAEEIPEVIAARAALAKEPKP